MNMCSMKQKKTHRTSEEVRREEDDKNGKS
jgi:hypothetical protein